MVRHKLDPAVYGAEGYTSVTRLVGLFGLVCALVMCAQLSLQAWYNGRMMPGVVVGGVRVGGLTQEEARRVLADRVQNYRLSVVVAGKTYEATAGDLGVVYNTEATVSAAYQARRGGWLPTAAPAPLPLAYHLDETRLTAFVESVATQVGVAPVDAQVQVKGAQLITVADTSGRTIDRGGLARLIRSDLASPAVRTITLSPRVQLADVQAKTLVPTLDEAKQLMATPIILTYGDRTFTPTNADIGGWLSFEKQTENGTYRLAPKVDEAKLKDYVNGLANKIDVAPVNEKVQIENGVRKTVREGAKGLAIDRDPLATAVAASVMSQTPLRYTITSHEVAFKTESTTLVSLEYGRYIEVNLATQHLWVWQDHNVIYDAPITSGAAGAGFPTITGLFSIYYKTTNTHLRGYQYGPRYNYDVQVDYWMPFYDGYGLHDASWRSSFGGSDYYYGGSHGCVNLPDDAAAFIYNWADVGTPVWVHK